MNRRRVLALLCGTGLLGSTSLLSGCLQHAPSDSGAGVDGDEDDHDRAVDQTDTPESGEIQRRILLANVDEVPEEHDLRIGVGLLEGMVTAEHTAHLRVTIANEGRKRRLSAGDEICNLFNRDKGASENPGLWLHGLQSAEWDGRKGDRWTRDRDPDEQIAYPAYGCLNRLYERGESVTNEYLVWDDYRVKRYMEPGTYRFEERIRIYAPEYDDWKDTLGEFTWGFDLRVEAP
ncbi:hypothetical protein [Haladaptatus sp. NG-SE-30]